MLARSEFENAVKEALRHYTQPDLLAENALLRTRLLTSSKPGAATPEGLQILLAETAKALFAGERDQRLYHVLDLTYLNPAPKQEAAASRLGLPYSTYRRHLTAGVDRLTEWLWKQELEAQRVETVAEQTTGSSERVERKLAAIFAADVAGYSRLMGADEEGTLARLKAHRRELIDSKIAEYRGRIVKTTGDGLLVEFASVVDAASCAVELQQRMSERNAGEPADKRIEFRVGINLGDIILDGDDVYGDGVNIAARLEGLAEPGGICISQTVLDHARGKVAFDIEDRGAQTLKNIAQPVHVYRVLFEGDRRTTFQPSEPAVPLPDKPSIAVLPFENMSGDLEQEFFADGMAEDIITALSKLRWFFVIARNSTFVYKGKSGDIRQVARELGVRYVLEGSVRKSSNRLRITAQLIDAITANHIWAERYDREIAEVFTVQDEITQRVVATIEPQLYAAEHLRIQSKPPESRDAWGCVIRALWHLGRITEDDNEHARQLLSRAVLLAPRYAKAHSLFAFAELSTVARGSSDTDTAMRVAEQHIHTALTLDDSDPWSHFSLGCLETLRSQQAGAIEAYQRAIELNPNFALAHDAWAGL